MGAPIFLRNSCMRRVYTQVISYLSDEGNYFKLKIILYFKVTPITLKSDPLQ